MQAEARRRLRREGLFNVLVVALDVKRRWTREAWKEVDLVEQSVVQPCFQVRVGQPRAGYARGSLFVFSQHCKALRAAGYSEAHIEAIPSWGSSDLFTPLERAVLAYTDDLV